jgi:hypothetical protein
MTTELREAQAERRARWVAALRSGEYKQARGLLRTRGRHDQEDRYCCLGVACEVARLNGLDVTWEVSSEGDYIDSLGVVAPTSTPHAEYPTYIEGGVLPSFVAEWYGISDLHGALTSVTYDDDRDFEASTLVDLNDNGQDFDRIADAIESNLEVV